MYGEETYYSDIRVWLKGVALVKLGDCLRRIQTGLMVNIHWVQV